ncbi:MAG: NADH-quinone oxidoreductase subunit C [Clostridia bacterium]|jgi:NADH-quinone oxidoreductase subunit C|nr:NADH-quinone oxidoreductase subunit C [Clostridia bacterium]
MSKQVWNEETGARFMERFPGLVEVEQESPQTTLRLAQDAFLVVMKSLKDEWGFDFLADLTVVDTQDSFLCIYHLMSWSSCRMVRVKVEIPRENPRIPSLAALWAAAEVQEREAYDMFGIVYDGHPHLKRIFLDEDFPGYPLRKDFQVPQRQR